MFNPVQTTRWSDKEELSCGVITKFAQGDEWREETTEGDRIPASTWPSRKCRFMASDFIYDYGLTPLHAHHKVVHANIAKHDLAALGMTRSSGVVVITR
jgi:hypothetical protein